MWHFVVWEKIIIIWEVRQLIYYLIKNMWLDPIHLIHFLKMQGLTSEAINKYLSDPAIMLFSFLWTPTTFSFGFEILSNILQKHLVFMNSIMITAICFSSPEVWELKYFGRLRAEEHFTFKFDAESEMGFCWFLKVTLKKPWYWLENNKQF